MTAPGSTVDTCLFDAGEDLAPGAKAFSIGAYLSAQRRLRGISLEELESVTRIPRRSLARLEAGAFDRQQDAFVRGFVRTVAVAVGLDPVDTLVRMLTGDAAVRQRQSAAPLRMAGLGPGALLLMLLLTLGAGAWLSGAFDLARLGALLASPEALPVVRQDYVREFAERVRTSPAGTFERPRPAAPPPAMFVAPALVEVALDAVLPQPGIDLPAPAAVSSR